MSENSNIVPLHAPKASKAVEAQPEKVLTPAAKRALAEAEARRRERDEALSKSPPAKEINGRGGLDPARYDDWEVKGIAVDF